MTRVRTLFPTLVARLILLFALAHELAVLKTYAQGTLISYQGMLKDAGFPATGIYDLRFAVYDASSAGARVSELLTNAASVVSNGLFTVALDFGPGVFTGTDRWLEIAVRTNGAMPFVTLAPRHAITATPYAITAANVSAPINGNSIIAGTITTVQLAPGTGAALTDIPSTSLVGPIPPNLLPDAYPSNNPAGFVPSNSLAAALGNALTVVTVSAKGIANGLSTITNDGAMFGPDTPGTLTSGIQEAINSLPRATTLSAPGGGRLSLGPGIFYTTTNIHSVNNTNPFALVMCGSGMNGSGITYVGAASQTVLTIGAPNTQMGTIFAMEHMWVASAASGRTNLLLFNGAASTVSSFGGVGRAMISDCWFGYWNSMTNNGGHGFTPASFPDAGPHDLIGVNMDCNYNDYITIERCSFTYLRVGVSVAADHAIVKDCIFEHVGFTDEVPTTSWPASSPFYMGAAITCKEPSPNALWNGNKHWSFSGNDFVGGHLAYYAGDYHGSSGLDAYPISWDDGFEGGRAAVATPGNRWITMNPRTDRNQISYTNYFVTNTADFSTYASNPAPSNMVQIVDLRMGRITGGLTITGSYQGDGSLLTNRALTVLTNSTPPTNATAIQGWLTVTNNFGKVGKVPVYY